jgi:hypothetical protein
MKKFLMLPLLLLAFGPVKGAEGDSTAAKPADEEFTKLKGQVDGLNESYLETKTTVDKLAKLKVGGYLQMQWQHADSNGIGSVAGGNFPGTSNQRFQLRRGRLKTTYDAGTSQYILEFEAVPSAVSLKDAEVILIEPWLKTFSLDAGLMDRPFGFEVGYSSSALESPERSRVYQTMFPGEKDLGAKLEINPNESMGFLSFLNFKGGLYTGTQGGSTPSNAVSSAPAKVTSIKDSTGKATKDTLTISLPTGKTAPAANGDEVDSTVDFIGRLGFKAPFNDLNFEIDGGVSTYLGMSLSGNDTVYQTNANVLNPTTGNRNKTFDRQAFGVDAQIYYDIPYIGGLSLRGEYLQGSTPGTINSNKPYGTAGAAVGTDFPNSYMALRNFMGWYVTWVQNFGSKFQTVVKYDVFDPNTDVENPRFDDPKAASTLNSANKLSPQDLMYNTLGLGAIYYWDSNLKFTVYYDIVNNEEAAASSTANTVWKKDLPDNVLTLRAQVKF